MRKKAKNFGKILFLSVLVLGLLFLFFVFQKEGKTFVLKGKKISFLKPQKKEEKKFLLKKRGFMVVLSLLRQTFPLSGVSFADILIEAPVANPGGVTRILAIFFEKRPEEVGSVRSVRPYMVDLAKGYDVILVSWGGCDAGVKRISKLNVDWFTPIVKPKANSAFFRKRNIPRPHNGFISLKIAENIAKKLALQREPKFKGFLFKEKTHPLDTTQEIKIKNFYETKFVYDKTTGDYLMYWQKKEMVDKLTSKQVRVKNVILMKTKIGVLLPGVADIKVEGKGEAKIYMEGKEIDGFWKKESPSSPLKFYQKDGKEIKFAPGKIYIGIVSKF